MYSFIAVQLCGEVAGAEGELDEEAAGGDDDQDGGAGPGLHEGQTEGHPVRPPTNSQLSKQASYISPTCTPLLRRLLGKTL